MPGFTGKVLAAGNRKLPKEHLIINLTSAQSCPAAALGMCAVEKECYARKCERIRPGYLAKNRAVEAWLDHATADEIYEMICAYVDAAPKAHPITAVRVNEAGDFRNQADVERMDAVAKRLMAERGIDTYGWSARKDLDYSNVSFILNGSSEDVKGAIRVFKAVSKEEFNALPKNAVTCGGSRGLNCTKCHICHQRKFRGTVYCLKH